MCISDISQVSFKSKCDFTHLVVPRTCFLTTDSCDLLADSTGQQNASRAKDNQDREQKKGNKKHGDNSENELTGLQRMGPRCQAEVEKIYLSSANEVSTGPTCQIVSVCLSVFLSRFDHCVPTKFEDTFFKPSQLIF